MSKTQLAAFVAAILFSGCTMSPEALRVAAAADPITSAQAEEAGRTYIFKTFRDPHSVQDLQIDTPRMLSPLATGPEWYIGFRCNAKNSFGGYTGVQEHGVYVKHGVIDYATSGLAESVLR
jgi:hypothetical protein